MAGPTGPFATALHHHNSTAIGYYDSTTATSIMITIIGKLTSRSNKDQLLMSLP